jgi:hypothetical protein
VLGLAVERRLVGVRDARFSLNTLGERLPFQLRSPIVRRVREPSRREAAYGWADFEAFAVAALKRMTTTLIGINREITAIGKTLRNDTPKVAIAAAQSADKRRSFFRGVGSRVDAHAQRMERLQVQFRHQITEMSTNYLERLRYVNADGASQNRPGIVGMRSAVADSRPKIVGMRESALVLRRQSVQQIVNQATDRLDEVIGRLLSDFDAVTRFTTDALKLIDEKIDAARIAEAEAQTEAQTDAQADGDQETT